VTIRIFTALLATALATQSPPPSEVRDEDALAQRFAPVVRLVGETRRCGVGDPYEPTDVRTLLGQETVALRGPWGAPSDLVFNDWNNTHEGDWEMIQLVFDAPTARDALGRMPAWVAYSQHEEGERAAWGARKLTIIDGTHPVVHVGKGSHAAYYDEELYLGSSASAGVGCDDTRGPSRELRPLVVTIPSDSTLARATLPWVGFAGRWGEVKQAFYNAPTGPNLNRRWKEPIAWPATWRDRSVAVPAGGLLGTSATDFFCGLIGGGSRLLRTSADSPLPTLVIIGVLAVIVVFTLTQTTWRPSAPLHLARGRAWGQIMTATGRMYVGHFWLFVGIGALTLPVSLATAWLEARLLPASSVLGVETQGERAGILVALVVTVGTAVSAVMLGLVVAAVARALVELDAGRDVSPIRAYRLAMDSLRPVAGALLIVMPLIALLLTSAVLMPFAIWLAIRWALVVPVIELEEVPAIAALRRSARLARGGRLRIVTVAVVALAMAVVAGPLLGAILILTTSAPVSFLNVMAEVIYAVTMPVVAIAVVYAYFDARVRHEAGDQSTAPVLPAEIPMDVAAAQPRMR